MGPQVVAVLLLLEGSIHPAQELHGAAAGLVGRDGVVGLAVVADGGTVVGVDLAALTAAAAPFELAGVAGGHVVWIGAARVAAGFEFAAVAAVAAAGGSHALDAAVHVGTSSVAFVAVVVTVRLCCSQVDDVPVPFPFPFPVASASAPLSAPHAFVAAAAPSAVSTRLPPCCVLQR